MNDWLYVMFIDKGKDYKKINIFMSKSEEIDKVNSKINEFLTKLYHEKLTEEENSMVAAFIHITISLKRISNRTKGFRALSEEMRDSGTKADYKDANKLVKLYKKTIACFDNMIESFELFDTETINKTMQEADNIEKNREIFKSEHLAQASNIGYSVEIGLIYSEAARHLARIAHNMKSVVETIPHDEIPDEASVDEAIDRR